MSLQKGDIIEYGIGIARIRWVDKEMAGIAYLARDSSQMMSWEAPIKDLKFLCRPIDKEDKQIPFEFFQQIQERNNELADIKISNRRRVSEKETAKRISKAVKTAEDKKLDKILEKITPQQLIDLLQSQ